MVVMVRKCRVFSLPSFIIPFNLGSCERDRLIKKRVTERKPPKNIKSFVSFPVVLIQQTLCTKGIVFLLPRKAEIKDLLIRRTYSWKDLDKNLYF